MLGGLTLKWKWRQRMDAAGKPTGRPSLITGPIQVCWHKFARYFHVELREIPLEKGRLGMTPALPRHATVFGYELDVTVARALLQLQPEQRQHAAGERFGLTQVQVEHQAQGQHQLDCEIGVAVLTTGRGAPGCCPARQRVLVQPQREVAAPAQASFVGRPVRDPVAGSGKAVAAGSVVLERHDRNLPSLPRTGYPGIHAPMPRRTGSDGRSSG